jgi:hypothetical protein
MVLAQHLQRGRALAVAAGPGHAALDGQAVPVVHEHVPLVDELGLMALGLAERPRVGIGRRHVRAFASALPVKVQHGRQETRAPEQERWLEMAYGTTPVSFLAPSDADSRSIAATRI